MTYIVMDAPGYYGTYAQVYSRHDGLDAAISAARRHRGRAIVSTDGGYPDNHQPGSFVHSQHALRYEIVWSAQMAQAARRAEQDERAAAAREQRIAKMYGRGSQQYQAAIEDRNFER